VSGDLGLLLEIGSESDGSALRRRWVHQLTDRREDGPDGAIVLGELLIQSSAVKVPDMTYDLWIGMRGDQVPGGARCRA
jgi:hypothetical protein